MNNISFESGCGRWLLVKPNVVNHLAAHPGITEILPDIVSNIILPSDGSKLECQVNLNRVVGQSSLLKTDKIDISDKSCFAKRKNRKYASRVVPDEEMEDTSLVSIIAQPSDSQTYKLVSAWFGPIAQKEPWDPDLADDPSAFEESIRFWCSHALVYSSDTMLEPFESNWINILKPAIQNN
jgi:hypothetical protein